METLLDTIAHKNTYYDTMEKLLDLRINETSVQYELRARWRGFDDEEPTWEPLSIMLEDIPTMVDEFLLLPQPRNGECRTFKVFLTSSS